jgi:hypothetical protein
MLGDFSWSSEFLHTIDSNPLKQQRAAGTLEIQKLILFFPLTARKNR